MRWLGIRTLAVMTGWVAAASAAPVTFSGSMDQRILLQSGTHADWQISNLGGTDSGTPTGTCNQGPGLALYDATLEPGGVNKGDAVDYGFTVWVNDAQFVSPDTVDVTGETLTAGPVTMSGLDVTVEYKALPSTPTFRARVTLHNPTNAAIGVSFRLATNFGSDANTGIRATATSGNWHVTSDDPTSPSDAVLVMVDYGPSDRAPDFGTPFDSVSTSTFSCSGNQGSELRTNSLTVPAGETVYFMQFLELAATVADATTAAAAFDVTPPTDVEDTQDISDADSFAIVNWNFFGDVGLVGGDAQWIVSGFSATSNRQGSGGQCISAPGIGLSDAELMNPTQGDAFDLGQLLFVGGQQLVPPIAEQHIGQSVVFGPQTLAGLDVTLSYVAFSDSPLLRTLVTLHNAGSAPISTTVQMATNFGSDDKTVVLASSNGNTTIETGDRWVVTADDANMPMDAVNTSVVAGPGTPAVLPDLSGTVYSCSNTNGLLSSFNLTLGAGETQALLFFNQLHRTGDAAVNVASSFDSPASPLDPVLSDIDTTTFARIVNFETCREPQYPDANCRLDGLAGDLTDTGTPGKAVDQLRLRLTTVKKALDKALAAARLGKQGPVHRALKTAVGGLKAFEHLLKTKKVKAALPDDARMRFAATSKSFRAQIKLLPTRVLG